MNQLLIKTFLDVLETRNFNRTADRLNITQSTVSARIRQLEEELGARLFERGRGGAEPTISGIRFETHCHSMLNLWGHAKRDVEQGGNKLSRRLYISAQYSLIRSFFLDWIDDLQETVPDLALHIEINFSYQIQRDVLSGVCDIGLLFAPQYLPDLIVSEVGSDDYIMVSTTAEYLKDVRIEDYIKVAYTEYFSRHHDENLSHLSYPALSAGNDDFAVEQLKRRGGTLYLPSFVMKSIAGTIPNLKVVKDAPVIPQPLYSMVHIRKRNDPHVVAALKELKSFTDARS